MQRLSGPVPLGRFLFSPGRCSPGKSSIGEESKPVDRLPCYPLSGGGNSFCSLTYLT